MQVQRSYAPTEEAAGQGRSHGMPDTGMEDLRVPWKADSFLPMGAQGFEAPLFRITYQGLLGIRASSMTPKLLMKRVGVASKDRM